MKKVVLVAAGVLLVLLAATYFYFSDKEYVVRLSEADIQTKLEQKLPITKNYLFIIQVTLDNPRVHLKNGSHRVTAGLDVVFNITINNNLKPVGGTVELSGGVTYLAEKGQFFLTEPVIENLAVQGIDSKYTNKANKALTKALAEYYRNHPIYTLRQSDTKQSIAKMILKNVVIENKKLVITLGI